MADIDVSLAVRTNFEAVSIYLEKKQQVALVGLTLVADIDVSLAVRTNFEAVSIYLEKKQQIALVELLPPCH